jgi:ATP-dependent Clp protease ATP-binding subunit ClpC
LTKTDLKRIITILTKDLVRRCRDQLDLKLTISAGLREYLVEEHTDIKMGARPLKRAIQTQLEDPLSEELLAGRIRPGDAVTAGRRNGKTVFTKKEEK